MQAYMLKEDKLRRVVQEARMPGFPADLALFDLFAALATMFDLNRRHTLTAADILKAVPIFGKVGSNYIID